VLLSAFMSFHFSTEFQPEMDASKFDYSFMRLCVSSLWDLK